MGTLKNKRTLNATIFTYYYQVFAIDQFGIKSNPSIEIEITTPNTVANNVKKEAPQETFKKTQNKKVEVIIPTQDFN